MGHDVVAGFDSSAPLRVGAGNSAGAWWVGGTHACNVTEVDRVTGVVDCPPPHKKES